MRTLTAGLPPQTAPGGVPSSHALPTITVRVEARRERPEAALGDLDRRLREALSAAIRVHPRIELLPPGTLPRAEGRGKARRVIDKRVN